MVRIRNRYGTDTVKSTVYSPKFLELRKLLCLKLKIIYFKFIEQTLLKLDFIGWNRVDPTDFFSLKTKIKLSVEWCYSLSKILPILSCGVFWVQIWPIIYKIVHAHIHIIVITKNTHCMHSAETSTRMKYHIHTVSHILSVDEYIFLNKSDQTWTSLCLELFLIENSMLTCNTFASWTWMHHIVIIELYRTSYDSDKTKTSNC